MSWFVNRKHISNNQLKLFFLSPYLSIKSLDYHPCKDESLNIRFVLFLFLTVTTVILSREFLGELNFVKTILIAPLIYFFTEAISSFGQLLFSKVNSYPMHRAPYLAISLSHFWGRDWNLWVQDWLRDISQSGQKSKRGFRIIFVFLISGLFHEIMVNLPYWVIYNKSYFGTMVAYFFIQAIALWIDKKFISHYSKLTRKIYMWLVIVIPSPLFINVPLLTFFGLNA